MDLTVLLTIFVLAGFVGYFVVWGVTPALHTPLMAVTNAISGIVVVAAILVAGAAWVDPALCAALNCPHPASAGWLQGVSKGVGFVAIVLCSVNIFGGFAITQRMLAMFKSKERK
jgi:NAD(P) transhydrogenase subunit alpha